MRYHVHLAEEAAQDLNQIFDYIAYELESVINADRQLKRIEKEIMALDTMPFRYRIYEMEPWLSLGVRRFSVDQYCIFYLPDENTKTVSVLRVLYGGRDIDSIMSVD